MSICAAIAIGMHLGTYHFDRERQYQEFNPGVYVVCDGWTAGAYRNSQNRNSAYIGKTFEHVLGPVDVTIGGVVGYTRAPVVPMLVPSIKIGHARASLLLPVEKGGGGIHVSWEF